MADLFDTAIVNGEDLRRFIQGRNLDANKDKPVKFLHVHEKLRAHVRSPKFSFRSLARPLIEEAFGKSDTHDPLTPSWDVIQQNLDDEKMLELCDYLKGTFITYRRGTDTSRGGEFVISALRVLPVETAQGPRLRFEIAYPIRGRDDEADTLIFGEVFTAKDRFHLDGYDHGGSAPYLLSCGNYPRDRIITDFTGLALRSTTNGKIFAARVFARRADTLSWPDAVQQCAILTPSAFKSRIDSKLFTLIQKHIDNKIDNKEYFSLLNYE